MKWNSILSLKILILLLSLNLISCVKTTVPQSKLSGNFKTEVIRELWQMCSIAYQNVRTPQYIYYPLCDCSVDVMRDNYDNSSMLKTLNNQESVELGVLVRLKCNQYTINMEEQ